MQAAGMRGMRGHFYVPHPLVTFWSPEGKAKRKKRGSQGSGSTSVLPHGASSCPCVLPYGAGLHRHLPLPMGWGAAGPDTGSPLFLQLLGAEGAVGGHTAGVSQGDAPGKAVRGNTALQLGKGAPVAAGNCQADKR